MSRWIVGMTVVSLCVSPRLARAQHEHQPSPYVGLEQREIRALSAEQVEQLRAGEGMGLALAAELNHYPGPRHVLDLAAELDLSPDQRTAVSATMAAMQGEARRLGEEILAQERALDQTFTSRTITQSSLATLTAQIARLQGELRFVHLRAHLAVRAVLSDEQVRRYDSRRGYAGSEVRR